MSEVMEEAAEPMQAEMGGMLGAQPETMKRENLDPVPARAELVKRRISLIKADKKHWEKTFKRMRKDAHMAREGAEKEWVAGDRYVTNITLRHITGKTSSLYARNPSVQVKRRERIMASVWDGTLETMQAAMATSMDPASQQILAEIQSISARAKMMETLAHTLKLVLQHQIEQQHPGFKKMMKHVVRRAVVQCVGYVKLGYVREGSATELQPDALARAPDVGQIEGTVSRINMDMHDKETTHQDADAEKLRLTLGGLHDAPFVVDHEGLVFDFPHPTAIIPHRTMTSLSGFQGCDWVTEQFLLTADKVKEYFGVAPSDMTNCTRYAATGPEGALAALERAPADENGVTDGARYCVWQTYDKTTGLVEWTMDGWHDYLRDPAPPEIRLERFWPWFELVFNEAEDDQNPYPPSDVYLLRHPQKDYNTARDGLRQHRRASRPRYLTADGALSDDDLGNLTGAAEHSVIKVQGLAPGQKSEDVVTVLKTAPIDPALYDTSTSLDDVMRAVGAQEAQIGGVSNGTATEASIAENSRISSVESNKDDLDTLLTELMSEAGKVVLRNMDPTSVKRIVGEGAVWPELSADDVMDDIYTTIQAGSSGKPNKAAELQNFERVAPFLMQIPGINPNWMAQRLLERLDDGLDLSEAFASGMPSITAMNAMAAKAAAGGGASNPEGAQAKPGSQPGEQGSQGANNAPGSGRGAESQPLAPPGMGSGQAPRTGDPSGM